MKTESARQPSGQPAGVPPIVFCIDCTVSARTWRTQDMRHVIRPFQRGTPSMASANNGTSSGQYWLVVTYQQQARVRTTAGSGEGCAPVCENNSSVPFFCSFVFSPSGAGCLATTLYLTFSMKTSCCAFALQTIKKFESNFFLSGLTSLALFTRKKIGRT